MTTRRELLIASGALVATHRLFAADVAEQIEMQTLAYTSVDGHELLLDLYRPVKRTKTLPVIVFLHGGGWTRGTRTTGPDFKRFFAQDGFAIASIEYRLAPSITFPANVEDVRTSVRWLRTNAQRFGLDPNRIGLWGTSAGGHLAAVAGLAPRGMFEGKEHRGVSSEVQCVLDAYGPVAFELMERQVAQERPTLHSVPAALLSSRAPAGGGPAGPIAHDDASSPESQLVGAPIQTVPDKVKAASPLTYVTSSAPPFLIMHGLADSAVPHGQSVLLYEALAKAGNPVTLRLIDNLPHTFFNRSDLDELVGPHRMRVRESSRGQEKTYEDRDGVFDVARDFFSRHLAEPNKG